MADADVVRLPRPPLPPEKGVLASEGGRTRWLVRCEGQVHVFAEEAGRCQCGEEEWRE